jgi:post-segregation antitoxin (ccd killing protein)
MPKGGKRVGAGRKPIGPAPRATAVSITLTAEDVEALRKVDANLSKAVRTLIARHAEEA